MLCYLFDVGSFFIMYIALCGFTNCPLGTNKVFWTWTLNLNLNRVVKMCSCPGKIS